MPGASHLNHMPSHTWSKVGRWGDAVKASLQAWESDQKSTKAHPLWTFRYGTTSTRFFRPWRANA